MTTAPALLPAPGLQHAFTLLLEFPPGERVRFAPAGLDFRRGFVAVAGGSVHGPLLQGKVVAGSGGDWPRLWPNGLVQFEAHYMLETHDGVPIYIHNSGIAYSSAETLRQIEAGEKPTTAPYCRITPRFEAPDGPYAWLNQHVFVGTAERKGDRTQIDIYLVS
jgi:hypothetical protein